MKLKEFLHNLHFRVDQLNPHDWEADWDDAPLPYKLYRGLETYPFKMEVPLAIGNSSEPVKPDFATIGHFLWYTYGLTQVSQSLAYPGMKASVYETFRRYLPSGGALYPNELYIYLKLEDLPSGIYHYDVAHHSLDLIREGNFDSYISKVLGNQCDVASCFAVVIISAMFWKNFFKYHNFSYRLQGLDTGVLICQLLEVAKRFGFATGVYFQFLDQAINHLVGLAEAEESTYAMIPLSVEATSWATFSKGESRKMTASELCREVPAVHHEHYVRSRNIKPYPLLLKMNAASMYETSSSFRRLGVKEQQKPVLNEHKLPDTGTLLYDLAAACRKRFSPEMDFILGEVQEEKLATLMKEAISAFTYRNDLDSIHGIKEPRVSLYACLNHIEDIPPGAYLYDCLRHSLKELRPGDQRLALQYSMTIDNVNLQQVPICFHIGGERHHYIQALGYRGYRIQQMEAGMLVQRVLLAASALGLGGHPLLSYDVFSCDSIYGLETQGKTSLIQLPVGPFKARPWLKGSLQS